MVDSIFITSLCTKHMNGLTSMSFWISCRETASSLRGRGSHIHNNKCLEVMESKTHYADAAWPTGASCDHSNPLHWLWLPGRFVCFHHILSLSWCLSDNSTIRDPPLVMFITILLQTAWDTLHACALKRLLIDVLKRQWQSSPVGEFDFSVYFCTNCDRQWLAERVRLGVTHLTQVKCLYVSMAFWHSRHNWVAAG